MDARFGHSECVEHRNSLIDQRARESTAANQSGDFVEVALWLRRADFHVELRGDNAACIFGPRGEAIIAQTESGDSAFEGGEIGAGVD